MHCSFAAHFKRNYVVATSIPKCWFCDSYRGDYLWHHDPTIALESKLGAYGDPRGDRSNVTLYPDATLYLRHEKRPKAVFGLVT